jgi:hypothetical protein
MRGGGQGRRRRSGGAQVLCGAPSASRKALKKIKIKTLKTSVPLNIYDDELYYTGERL